MLNNKIPKDLFSVRENEYTILWAKRTYPYAKMFSVTAPLIPSDSDIKTWRDRALAIRHTLIKKGNNAGKQKLLEIAKYEYNMKMIDTDVSPNSVFDILSIVGDSKWYNDNKQARREQVYMMMYGLLRRGKNQWALDIEMEEMKKYNISYVGKDGLDPMYNGKGCIYSILTKVFSNTNTKRFRDVMWSNHKEYLCVRTKKQLEQRSDVTIEKLTCRWGSLHLIREKNNTIENEKMVLQESSQSTGLYNSTTDKGKNWAMNSFKAGITVKELYKQVDSWKCEFDIDKIVERKEGEYL